MATHGILPEDLARPLITEAEKAKEKRYELEQKKKEYIKMDLNKYNESRNSIESNMETIYSEDETEELSNHEDLETSVIIPPPASINHDQNDNNQDQEESVVLLENKIEQNNEIINQNMTTSSPSNIPMKLYKDEVDDKKIKITSSTTDSQAKEIEIEDHSESTCHSKDKNFIEIENISNSKNNTANSIDESDDSTICRQNSNTTKKITKKKLSQDDLEDLRQRNKELKKNYNISLKDVLEVSDIRYIILSHLFLICIGDGRYDARSRALIRNVASYLNVDYYNVIKIEKEIIEQIKSTEDIENIRKDTSAIDNRASQYKKKRWLYMGLASISK